MNHDFSRRDLIKFATAGFAGVSASGWLPAIADDSTRRRSCILLWMNGGPSQLDTLDPKTEHENGGPTSSIDTSVKGIQISEHLPNVAKQMEHIALIRSMKTKEGDHARANYLLRTGNLPQGAIHYPTIGATLSKELGSVEAELPNFVSIAPFRNLSPASYNPGFLGPKYAPLVVGDPVRDQTGRGFGQRLRVRNLNLADDISARRADARLKMLGGMEDKFVATRGGVSTNSHQIAYKKAVRMMRSKAVEAFDLEQEPTELRDAYGRTQFGQGCLLARRLVQRGVPFVEVSLTNVAGTATFGWDTHRNNFNAIRQLTGVLDPAWATLIQDLKDHGLLDSTLIVWMGEFGRTPRINRTNGRDHYPAAWSTALCGGGIRGGQVVGRTSKNGMEVEDRPVSVNDLIATTCEALGIDPTHENMSNIGRPIPIASLEAETIEEILL